MKSLSDKHVGKSDGVAATGTGGTDGEVDTTQMEDGAEVHVDCGVHGLEYQTITQHGRVVLLVHDTGCLDDGFGRRVIAENTADFVLTQIGIVKTSQGKGLTTGHIGILGFLGHSCTSMAVEHLFRNNRSLDQTCQPGTVSIFQPLGL